MKPKVLVVDDETDFVQLTEYNLLRQGFEVFTAFNGVEALHQARRILPDVILLDLMLPDIDGASVCEILRSQPSTADVPVIVVSALDGMVSRGRSAEVGVACYFKKPVDMGALGDRVRLICEQQKDALKSRLTEE
jgi:two-component system alkaline phosphatase synthesis response regulator PhoP